LGTIENRKYADIVAVSGDLFQHITEMQSVINFQGETR